MKKLFFLAATIVFFAISSQAQESQNDSTRHTRKHLQMPDKGRLARLNLTDEQKQKTKEINEDYRKQFSELRSNNNMTLGDYKAKTEALKKEQKQKLQDILSPEQKEQLAGQRKNRAQKSNKIACKRFDKMKQDLALTSEQSDKLKQNREDFQNRVKAVRQDQSLTESQKKEQVKELAKQQRENMKTILTPEQLEKMKTRTGSKKTGTVK